MGGKSRGLWKCFRKWGWGRGVLDGGRLCLLINRVIFVGEGLELGFGVLEGR